MQDGHKRNRVAKSIDAVRLEQSSLVDEAIQVRQKLAPTQLIQDSQARILEKTTALDLVLTQQGRLMQMLLPLAAVPGFQSQTLEGLKGLQLLLSSKHLSEVASAHIDSMAIAPNSNPAAIPASTECQSRLGFRFSRYKKIACDPLCGCACHRKHRNSSPRMLRRIIGQIFCAYAGVPLKKVACNEVDCRQQHVLRRMSLTTFLNGLCLGCCL